MILPIVVPSFVKFSTSPLWKPVVTATVAEVCVELSRSLTVTWLSTVTPVDAPT